MNNRSMAIFIIIMFITGTLERNGLKEQAANLLAKVKGASAGLIIGLYGIMRGIFGTYIYRIGLIGRQYSLGTAVGLVKSIIGLVLILGSNKFVEKKMKRVMF